MNSSFELIAVENDHPVTNITDRRFLHLIQHAALLGIKDLGYLNEMQYRHAHEALRRQYIQKQDMIADNND